jgi:hypothetical protein
VFGYRPDCRNHLSSLFVKKFRVHGTLITAPSETRLADTLKSLDAIPNLFAYYSFFQSWNEVGGHVPCNRISFDLRAIRISGPPWNTLVAVDWLESNSGTDGVRTFTIGRSI